MKALKTRQFFEDVRKLHSPDALRKELPTGSALLPETALTAHHESTCEFGFAKQVGSSSPNIKMTGAMDGARS
jgi:hypothetical protein